MSRSAYLQGDMDGLCGVYSVVNAAKLVHEDFRGDKAYELFSKCLKEIEKRKPLSRIFEGGMKARDLKALLREVLAKHYKIKIRRPFKASGIKLRQFLREIQEFIEEDSNRAVIVCFGAGWEMIHWSVIKSTGRIQVSFCDSAGWNRISRRRLTTRKATSRKPFLFETKETYFLSNGS
jgi:hypothetical protein